MTGERVQSADFTCGWGVLSGLQRPHVHTSRAGSFCVEYWHARPLQSISDLMRCDAVPLSCWNRFLRKTYSIFSLFPLSVFSVFSIFPAVSLRMHNGLRKQAEGWQHISVPIRVVLQSHTRLLGFPFPLSLSDYTCLCIHAFSVLAFVCVCVCETEREKRGGQLLAVCCECKTVVSTPSSCLASLP